MTAGEGIKKTAEGTKKVTDRVVDAVEDKVADVTDGGAVHRGADKVRGAASHDSESEKK